VVASALGLGFAILLELLVKASHPPAAATLLLMTLGGFPAILSTVFNVAAGVVIVATTGEGFRRLRLMGK
jgi:CBS-domain-containing membrane protein